MIAGGVPLVLTLLYLIFETLGAPRGSLGQVLIIVFFGLWLLDPVFHLIGAGLGLGGLLTSTRKLYPVTGTVLNFLLGIGWILIKVFVI